MKNMGKVILGLTISLDGFAEDINGSVGALYPDLDTLRNRSYGNPQYQVPIFVFTDKALKKHPKETDKLTLNSA